MTINIRFHEISNDSGRVRKTILNLLIDRVYTHPPDSVTMVISAVCVVLQEKTSSWTVARQVMADPHFIKRLISIDIDKIPEKVLITE